MNSDGTIKTTTSRRASAGPMSFAEMIDDRGAAILRAALLLTAGLVVFGILGGIVLDQGDPSQMRARILMLGMALVAEGRRLFGELTVRENLLLGLRDVKDERPLDRPVVAHAADHPARCVLHEDERDQVPPVAARGGVLRETNAGEGHLREDDHLAIGPPRAEAER